MATTALPSDLLSASAVEDRLLPPLQSGDRLTRAEFERRYDRMPRNVKAELIEGMVYTPSPVRYLGHGRPHGLLIAWLVVNSAGTPGVQVGDNATVRLDLDNEVQPDGLLRIEPELGGHSRVTGDDYLEGAPELVVELAASSAAYDLHDKLHVYRRNGVEEYIVWLSYERRIAWFRLREGQYVPLEPGGDGILRSEIFPGLHLHVQATLGEDAARVLATLQHGLATREHAVYVARLAELRSQSAS